MFVIYKRKPPRISCYGYICTLVAALTQSVIVHHYMQVTSPSDTIWKILFKLISNSSSFNKGNNDCNGAWISDLNIATQFRPRDAYNCAMCPWRWGGNFQAFFSRVCCHWRILAKAFHVIIAYATDWMGVSPNRTIITSQWIITWPELGGNKDVNTIEKLYQPR